ncbi:MAG: 3-oxoacyl-ACP reductase [Deltaproteobacteria bacterium]|nr:3-oxoacyl-ACP reductase [Deltaproteobacteria bacterium]
MGELEGKVAVITGAGRGLGRAHALELAGLGARVVVNDLGVAADGSGRDESAGQAVVDEIKSSGGEAVAHFGDVADWNDSKAMIQTAIDTFGDLNILVSNAGFCRDKMIFSMDEDEFDSVIRVHLKGHFCGIRHASEYFRSKGKAEGQVYGRILSTASEAALFASPGQPNYSAAKAGIIAVTNGAAQGLAKYGVTANTLMPRARTAMTLVGQTAQLFQEPEEGFDTFAPENVSPLVGWLASPAAANVSANVFIVWGKQIAVMEYPKHAGDFENVDAWTVESVGAALGGFFEGREPVKDSFIVPPTF